MNTDTCGSTQISESPAYTNAITKVLMQASGQTDKNDPAFKIRLDELKTPSRDYTIHPMYEIFMSAPTGDKLLDLTRSVTREAFVNKHNIHVLASGLHKQKKVTEKQDRKIAKQGADILQLRRVILKLKHKSSPTAHRGILEILYIIHRGSHCFLTCN